MPRPTETLNLQVATKLRAKALQELADQGQKSEKPKTRDYLLQIAKGIEQNNTKLPTTNINGLESLTKEIKNSATKSESKLAQIHKK